MARSTDKVYTTQNFILDIIFLCGALMNFLPFFLGYSLKSESQDGQYPDYLNELQKFPFKSALVASAASCAPFFIDLLLDMFSNVTSEHKYVPRKAIISALIIPDLLFLCYILPNAQYDIIPGLGGMRDTIFHYVILSHLNILRPDIFSKLTTMVIATLLMITNIILSFQLIISDESLQYISFVIIEFLMISMTILVIYLCYKWGYRLYQIRNKQYSIKDQTCTIYIMSYTTFFFIDCFMGFYPNAAQNPLWGILGAHFLTLINYSMAVSVMVISVTTTRYTRIESEQSKSKIRQTFVSYFCHEMNTPLNSAVMGIDILKNRFPDASNSATYRDVIADIEDSCSSLAGILRDLVIYERIESNGSSSKFPGIPLFPIILEQLNYYQDFASNRNTALVVHDNSVENYYRCDVFADKEFVLQIMRTILTTSIESAGSDGKVEVIFSLRSRQTEKDFNVFAKKSSEAENYEFCIDVRDDGPAIVHNCGETLFPGVDIEFTAGVIEMGRLSGFGVLVTRKLLHLLGGSLDYSALPSEKSSGGDKGKGQLEQRVNNSLEGITCQVSERSCGNRMTVRIPVSVTRSESLVSDNDQVSLGSCDTQTFHKNDRGKPLDLSSSSSRNVQDKSHVTRSTSDDDTNLQLSPTSNEKSSPTAGNPQKYSIPDGPACNTQIGSLSINLGTEADSRSDGKYDKEQSLNVAENSTSLVLNREPLKALVVDDSAINQKMLLRLIQNVCETVETAGDGQEAVEIFQRALEDGNPFDIVLMDYQMPRMDGPSAAKIMREMGYKGPIIGVTGNILPAHTKTFLVNGADVVLLKPVKSEDILRIILG